MGGTGRGGTLSTSKKSAIPPIVHLYVAIVSATENVKTTYQACSGSRIE